MLLHEPANLISVFFQLSRVKNNIKVNPINYLEYLLEDSGTASLNDYLTSTGLVIDFEASMYDQTSFHTIVLFNIKVRRKGMHRSEFLVRMILDYMEFLKDKAIDESVYRAYATAKRLF